MKELELTVSDIKDLIDTFSKNKLGSLKLAQGEFSLELEARETEQAVITAWPAVAEAAPAVSEAKAPEHGGSIVKAPIVGTFYAAPAPDKDAYVSVGSRVKKGDVLFIIESMKLMNEVTSEFDGTVSQILVANGTNVEYGQPILNIE